jgi:hypothetical protein
MAKVDLDKWLEDSGGVALRIRSEDLKDFLGLNIFSSGSLRIPQGTVGLHRSAGEGEKLLRAGEEVSGDFDLILVKEGDVVVAYKAQDLRSADDFPFAFSAEIVLSVDCLNADAVSDFGTGFLQDRDTVTSGTLKKFLRPHLDEIIRDFTAAEDSRDLGRGDRSRDIEKAFRSGLKRLFFEKGFDLEDVRDAQLESEQFEQLRDERLSAAIEEERTKRQDIIRQAWMKDKKNVALSNQEIKDFVKALEHEGALREIERRKEKAQAEKELWNLVEEKEKQKLEQDLSNASQVMETLEKAGFKNVFEKFIEIAEKKSGAEAGDDLRKAQAHGIRAQATHRLLAVAGYRVLAFDPRKPGQAPSEVFDLAGGELGMIRSVRAHRDGDGTVLLAGAQYGVYVLRESEGFAPNPFRIPGAGDRRGGINAAVLGEDRLLATHSDYGVLSWPREGGEGAFLRPDLTRDARTVRGILAGPEDTFFFAAGKTVYSLFGSELSGTPTAYEGADAPVTALWVTRAAVFAGTKSGDLLRWKIGEPFQPTREIAKGVDPIYMIKPALIDRRPCLLVGWKGYGVLAKVLETHSQVQYLSDARIRWVDGESDFVFGVDRESRRILVWKADVKTNRSGEFVTDDRVQDIWVWPRDPAPEPGEETA